MIDITAFFRDDPRVQIYRAGTCDAQETCVLYWMQRGGVNLALDAAIALSNALDVPIVVLFVVADYPAANLRHYTFLLEGITHAAIGGKHDRPWGPERPIFGLIRPMSLKGIQRKMDLRAYISRWSKQ